VSLKAIVKLVAVFAAVLAVVPIWRVISDVYDPRTSAEDTAAALQQRLHTKYGFTCTREEGDQTIELADVDYVCQATRPSEPGYWVGTGRKKITGTQSMG